VVNPAPYFACVRDTEGILICAFRTLPERLCLTRARRTEALPALAADANATNPGMREVIGPEPTVAAFAQILAELRGKRAHRRMSQRIYVLRVVDPVEPRPPGRFRVADAGDLDLIIHWVKDFLVDIGERGDPREISEVRIRDRKFFLWEDEVPVSMAAWAGKTPSGVRVNFVYTPPERRGRGYATVCVAALSQLLLDKGNKYCCLYTDLANPVSNAVYQRIGYRPVCDSAVYRVNLAPGSQG
jgi:predicted GNAT family acetyltransferase